MIEILFIAFLAWCIFLHIRGESLKKKFRQLGNPEGKTPQEIIAIVGSPDSNIYFSPEFPKVFRWRWSMYEVILCFKNDICVKVSINDSTFSAIYKKHFEHF